MSPRFRPVRIGWHQEVPTRASRADCPLGRSASHHMKGQGLRPYQAGEITNLFDWAENPRGASQHAMPHRSQFIVDIVQIEANAVHQPSKPGDEIVLVLHGTLELTDDADKKVQRFSAGKMVLIPSGWAGLYRVIPDDTDFLELALVPGDYFDAKSVLPPSGQSPRPLKLPSKPGRRELHRGRYLIESVIAEAPERSSHTASGDEIVYVLGGELKLTAGERTGTFQAGSVVVLPRGFSGTIEYSAGYQSVVARWVE